MKERPDGQLALEGAKWRFDFRQLHVLFSRDLQQRFLSDSYAGDGLSLALRAIVFAPASAARPSVALLCYPSPPSH